LGFLNFLLFLLVANYFVYNVDMDSKRDLQRAMETSSSKSPVQIL
jgi:peptide/histidine transporter 3/4